MPKTFKYTLTSYISFVFVLKILNFHTKGAKLLILVDKTMSLNSQIEGYALFDFVYSFVGNSLAG